MTRASVPLCLCVFYTILVAPFSELRAQGRGGRGGDGAPPAPPTAQASATVDLSGYWVSLITEDWRWRMVPGAKGDVTSGVPVTQAARDAANAWDPAKDQAAGNQCKPYGAAGIMRMPTRIRFSWENENVLKLETDAGTQTRLFRFGAAAQVPAGERTWQGSSVAVWEPQAGGRGGRGGRGADATLAAVRGSLKVVTTNLKPGYLLRNGVPYGEKATVTEYFNRTPETYGVTYLVVTTVVEDPDYLTEPYITSSHFRKLPDTNNGWNPTPCVVP